jgi:hypothetical protein
MTEAETRGQELYYTGYGLCNCDNAPSIMDSEEIKLINYTTE